MKNIPKNNNRKNIVMIGLNGRAGPLQYASCISSSMANHANITLVLPSYSDASEVSKNVELLRLEAPTSIFKTLFLTINPFVHRRIIKKINDANPDAINILDIHPWHVMYWPFLKGKKYVTINDPQLHSGEAGPLMTILIKAITRFLLKRADTIIVLSEKQKSVVKKLGYKQNIITTKIGSFDFFAKKESKKYKEEKNTILFFGRIKEYKGLKYLLDSLIYLKDSGMKFKLIIAGEGDIAEYKDQLAKLKGFVELDIEYIPDSKVAKYFERSSFVVMPYTDATQTAVVQVASSFEKPVIATNVGSLPEVVIDGKTGTIIEPRNTKELAFAIKKLLDNKAYVKKLGKNAKIFMHKELDWKIISKKLYEDMEKYLRKA